MKFFDTSPLEEHRLYQQMTLPKILEDPKRLVLKEIKSIKDRSIELDSAIKQLFPHSIDLPILCLCSSTQPLSPISPLRVGIVLSGGQAPGGHNVIAGVFDTLKELNPSCRLIGFLNGLGGIIKNVCIELTEEMIAPYRNQGGFNLLGSGRTKIETLEQFESVGQTLLANQLDGLVVVGGDDSNTSAAFLTEFCREKEIPTRIVGIPKTIDGDLKNEFIEISFGFDTASKVYSEIIGNLLKDAVSSKKYYFFVKMMGRSASHLTLECALQTHVNLALIGEEIEAHRSTLSQIIDEIADLICERAKHQKEYGVILIPEGIFEFIPLFKTMMSECNHAFAGSFVEGGLDPIEDIQKFLSPPSLECFMKLPKEIQKQLLLERDASGNIQLSKIETERLIILLVEKELAKRKKAGNYSGKFNAQSFFCGYEGRSSLPTAFDCEYCYALGRAATLFINLKVSGYLCCIQHLDQAREKWKVMAVPIVQMLHFEMRKNKKEAVIKKALVDINGKLFSHFKREREKWKINDHYRCPGPIQFHGPHQVVYNLPYSLLEERT